MHKETIILAVILFLVAILIGHTIFKLAPPLLKSVQIDKKVSLRAGR